MLQSESGLAETNHQQPLVIGALIINTRNIPSHIARYLNHYKSETNATTIMLLSCVNILLTSLLCNINYFFII